MFISFSMPDFVRIGGEDPTGGEESPFPGYGDVSGDGDRLEAADFPRRETWLRST